ncbi:hypothetical protein [Streptomyces sp. NPDC040750]|uniref:hypothetical protein n=1 Tax=Streptomyces sp. NPDC040750 TaxID=3154491 RepID=UPI0033D3EDC9
MTPPDTSALEAALRAEVDGEVRFDAGSRGAYSTDGSNYACAAGPEEPAMSHQPPTSRLPSPSGGEWPRGHPGRGPGSPGRAEPCRVE